MSRSTDLRAALLALVACGGPAPDPAPADGGLPPACFAYEYLGTTYDCREVDPCDLDADTLSARLACCACDARLCEPDPTCPPWVLPDFPPDDGPVLAFSGSLESEVFEHPVRLTPSGPDGLIVAPARPEDAVHWACSRDRNTLACEGGMIRLGGRYRLDLFEVRLADADGDGVADGGWLRVVGSYIEPMSAMNEQWSFEALTVDAAGGVLALPPVVLPGDRVFVGPDELVAPGAPLGLDANGPVPLDPWIGAGGALFGWRSEPVTARWSTPVVGVGEAVDLAGHPMSWGASQVVDHPGSAADNLGFEGDEGWATGAFFLGVPDSLAALEGDRAAFTYGGGVLVGELAVPASGAVLDFHWALGGPAVPSAARLEVVAEGGVAPGWALDPATLARCDGFPCAPWTAASVDLTPWSGQVVVLRFAVDSPASTWTMPPVPPRYDFAVDGLSLR